MYKNGTENYDVYTDLESAKKAMTDAAVELIRGNEHAAKMILIDWLAKDKGQI